MGYYELIWESISLDGREVQSAINIARLLVPPKAGVTPEHAKSIKMLLLK